MALPKIISLTAACLLFLQGSHANGSPSVEPQHSPTDCLTAMNDTRKAAGLAAFTKGANEATLAGLAIKDKLATPFKSICEKVQQGVAGYHKSATFFFAHQTGAAADCPAAVAHWQGGLSKFTGSLPPAYSNSTAVYSDAAFVGLVALYNPNAGPTLDCEFVMCPITSTSTQPPSTTSVTKPEPTSTSLPEDDEENEGKANAVQPAALQTAAGVPAGAQRRRLEAMSTYNALVCMTTPPALVEGEEPFDKDQWKKIVGAISGSPAATLSLFSLIALAALSIALFWKF